MRRQRGFTIVEVLVVVSIIALLVGLLLPALSSVRKTSRATVSLSNLRQWGVGTMNFCTISQDLLPWEGFKDAAQMPQNFADKDWWANAIPPFVGQRPYRDLAEATIGTSQTVPIPPDEGSIFIDPGALVPPTAPYIGGAGANAKPFFFCYVPNSQLNNTYQNNANWGSNDVKARMKLTQIKDAEHTILMLEMRTVKIELKADDPHYNRDLARHRADWKRFAARHFDGGHMLFADGHAQWISNLYATTNKQNTRNPSEANGDWNHSDLVWDPMGPATDE